MNQHRYIIEPLPKLELDKKRFRVKFCPCGKSNKDGKFVPYVGFENNGYCHSCGETFLPELQTKTVFGNTLIKAKRKQRIIAPKQKPISFISPDFLKASLQDYDKNKFILYLIVLFGNDVTSQLISKYFIGTSKHWNGATVFWQIDIKGKIRTGKIMLYSPITGKRVKEPYNHINWVHIAIKQPEFVLQQCLFGEHLLHDKTKPIAIVESEKTAIIASVYLPQFIWVAVGGKDGISEEKLLLLRGRNITFFPDLKGFDIWNAKAKELSHIANFAIT